MSEKSFAIPHSGPSLWDMPKVLSRYQPLARIGRDGTAEEILAEMRLGPGITKLAVLKRVWPDLAKDAGLLSLFMDEVRLGARMNHPNIIQTYDFVDDKECPILVLEYLDGQPLTRILNRLVGANALSLPLRLRIIANILAALDYAHELTDYEGKPASVLHGDVNPQSVFVTYAGQVKLLDFRLANRVSVPYQTPPQSPRGKLGYAYLAPEQVAGGKVDRRADLFAVGVLLWEISAGRRLWQGMDEAAIIGQLGSRIPVPPFGRHCQLPQGLDRICARALARDPGNRYSTASEFATDIHRLLPGNDDSHGRHLGKVVSLAFGEERETRRALIEAHLVRTRAPLDQVAAEPPPPILAPRMTPGPLWTFDAQEKMRAQDEIEIEIEVGDDFEVQIDGEHTPVGTPPPLAPRAEKSARSVQITQVVDRNVTTPLRWAVAGFMGATLILGLIVGGISFGPGSWRAKARGFVFALTGQPTKAPASKLGTGARGGPVPARMVVAPIPAPADLRAATLSTLPAAPTPAGATASGPAPGHRRAAQPDIVTAGPSPGEHRRHRRQTTTSHEESVAAEPVRKKTYADPNWEDDILQPSVDLSVDPFDTIVPEPATESPKASSQAPRFARRVSARPLDTADPFEP